MNPEFDLFYEIRDNGRRRYIFPTTGLLLSAFEPVIVEQINYALKLFVLPEEIRLTADDAGLGIEPQAIETIGTPREHFGISANLNAL